MTDRELMQQALEALERCVSTCFDQRAHEQVMSRPEHFVNQNITALRERLAKSEQWEQLYPDIGNPFKRPATREEKIVRPGVYEVTGPLHVVCQCDKCKAHPEQEPVAWMQEMPTKGDETRSVRLTTVEALAREEWSNPISLYTAPPRREWVGLTRDEVLDIEETHPLAFYRAIEAKLEEKNNG